MLYVKKFSIFFNILTFMFFNFIYEKYEKYTIYSIKYMIINGY